MWPSLVAAQPSGRKWKIGVFWPFDENDRVGQERIAAITETLQNLGWIEGTNVSFEEVRAKGDAAELSELARRMVATNVDVIVVATAGQADLVHNATRTIPIVVCGAGDLEATGLNC